jgi:hydrogenase expression/formation protein HypE
MTHPSTTVDNSIACPLPIGSYDRIVMGHGSGGRLSGDLLKHIFLPAFSNEILDSLEDQATLQVGGGRLAFTTDSFVVRPLFFPGGDIGKLAVNGTVNDLAVGGAVPLFISAAFILEEGFSVAELDRVAKSMGAACRAAGITLVTGDTKVVDRGKGDKLFITTSGIGLVRDGISLSASQVKPGDRVIVSGTIGDHGMAVMSVREGIEFETTLESDTAPLTSLVQAMLQHAPDIRCMRDPTRGGLASSLNEISTASRVGIRIRESTVPVRGEVKGACEILGLDPLYVANEGKLVAVVPEDQAASLVDVMRNHPLGHDAAIIGEAIGARPGIVTMQSTTGGERIVSLLTSEQLPRIC